MDILQSWQAETIVRALLLVLSNSSRSTHSGHKDKDSVASRAYIAFATAEALVNFHKAYDGWTFRDKSGRVSHAVVEFAPYQQTAPKTDRKDAKQGTIEQGTSEA